MNKLNYTISEVKPRMFFLHFKKQYDMCMMFLRYQEFYESPNDKFRNQAFTLLDYMEWYSYKYGKGSFTYPVNWIGFNIPSKVIARLDNLHIPDFNRYDTEMFKVYGKCLKKYPDGNFYLLGSTDKGSTMKHEIAHGFFYMNDDYKREMTTLVKLLDRDLYKHICQDLKAIGYTKEVYIDECQAYMSTGIYNGFTRELNGVDKSFIEIFKKYYAQT